MAQVSYGTITVSDLTDITDIFLQYAKAVDSITITNDYTFSQTGEIGWYTLTSDTSIIADKYYFELINNEYKIVLNPTGNPVTHGWYESSIYPTWTSGYQIWIRQVTIKDGIDIPDYGTPYLDKAVNQINNSINQINNTFDTTLKYFWTNLVGSQTYPAGTYTASGINNVTFDIEDSSTYGYNTYYGNGISLRYNAVNMATLDGSALTFYQPPTISGNTVTPGNPTMRLSGNALTFYNPTDGVTAAATLSSTGLNILEGTITLGNNFSVDSEGSLTAIDGTIGGWSINSTSLYSLNKSQWDLDEDGIFIGNYERKNYKLSEDTSVQEGKKYYSYDNEHDIFEEIESTSGQNPKQNKWYEEDIETIFTLSGGRIQYVETDDTKVNEKQTYYKLDDGVYEQVSASEISEATNPKLNNWYISLGPMWYINSDGSASFGSLLVNRTGSLNVPAASISGKLTADQIEVDNLGAISANIGSTIDSDITSNTFKADSKIKWVLSNDTKVVSDKDYYSTGSISGRINFPSGNPKNEGYYEQIEDSYILLQTSKNNYKLTEDAGILIGKEYYYYDVNYELSKDIEVDDNKIYYNAVISDIDVGDDSTIQYSPVIPDEDEDEDNNPKEKQWYEKQSEYILANGDFTPTKDITAQENKKYYEYNGTNYSEVINPSGNLKYKRYYEKVTSPSAVDWYELVNTRSAEIVIEDGDISINSNETTVLATNAETTSLDLFNVNCVERIKFGKVELIPYNGGLAVQVSDGEVNNGN